MSPKADPVDTTSQDFVGADMIARIAPELSDPRVSLPAYGRVHGQKESNEVAFNPSAITKHLQNTIVSYMASPPTTEHGQTKWLVLVGPRQGGKSTVPEFCAYVQTAYQPGHDHVCIADTKDRAQYLHSRVHYLHTRWPGALRVPTLSSRERNQITFDNVIGGKMRVLSMESAAVSIGQSPDSVHWSEVPFCSDASEQWGLMNPSLINKDKCRLLLESTAAPDSMPSTDFWRETVHDAQRGVGRWLYAFFPFWDVTLNERPWASGTKLDAEEERLLEKYGPLGLTKRNLAFRRESMETNREFRRNPDLFAVYYPFDDVTCWLSGASGVIHRSMLERHTEAADVEWRGPYMEFEPPQPGAIYVIGADPAGYGVRDHASFQVLKIYESEWTQVACFSDNLVSPVEFSRRLLEAAVRYNKARVVIEANGVGAACIALAEQEHYPNLFYETAYKPGFTSTSVSLDRAMAWLCDALLDSLVLHDKDTVMQLMGYRNDKRTETAVVTELIRGTVAKGRRERHHWDKVSALIMAVVGARTLPQKPSPGVIVTPVNRPQTFTEMSYNRQQAYREAVSNDQVLGSRRRRMARIRYRRG